MHDYPHDGDGDGHGLGVTASGPIAIGSPATEAAAGTAALLLVESLIHHLISRSVLSVGEAIEIVEVAADVEREMSLTLIPDHVVKSAATLLSTMIGSLRFELRD